MRGFNSQPDLLASESQHCQADVPDDNLFTYFSTQNQHRSRSFALNLQSIDLADGDRLFSRCRVTPSYEPSSPSDNRVDMRGTRAGNRR
jgi:hypothetical protein